MGEHFPSYFFGPLFKANLDAVCFYDLDGRVVRANAPACAMIGSSPGAFHNASYLRHVAARDHDAAKRIFSRALWGVVDHNELTFVSAEGIEIPVEIHLVPARDADGTLRGVYGIARDMRAVRAAEDGLQRSAELFRSLFDQNPDPVMLIAPSGVVQRVNVRLEDFANVGGERLVGKDWLETISASSHSEMRHAFLDAAAGTPAEAEGRFIVASSTNQPLVRFKLIPLYAMGAVVGICAVVRDITLERASRERVEHMAFYDDLTGLPNRALLRDRLQQTIATSKRYGNSFAVHYMDLDDFKDVNDTYGHEAGDALLRDVAERLRTTLRASDTVSRLSGDEFVLLQPLMHVPNDAIVFASKLIATIARPFEFDDGTARVGATIGIAIFPQDGVEADALLRAADAALYDAKAHGKNTYRLA